MSTEQKGYKILLGTTAQWGSSTTVPAKGQICINTDDQSIRVGDGIKSYAGLSPLTTEYEVRTFFADFGLNYIPEISTIQRVSPEGGVLQEIILTNLNDLYNTYGNTTLDGAKQIIGPVEVITEDGRVPFTVHGPAVFDGDVTIQGETTIVDAENLKVKDKLITVAKDNAAALTSPAGLHVPNYDGAGHDGALVFDHTGTAYVGDVVIDNGNINTQQSDLQPLATRSTTNDDGLVNGNLIQWNSAKTTLVDSGKTVEDFVPKIKNEDLNFKCYVERGFTDGSSKTMILQATIGDFSNSIIQRDADGRAKINTPTTDLDGKYIVNKEYVNANFVQKITGMSGTRAYIFTPNGDGQMIVTADLFNSSIVSRDKNGAAKVNTPEASESDTTSGKYIVNREYAEDNFVAKVSTKAIVYGTNPTDGSPVAIPWNTAAVSNTVVMRDNNGRTKVAKPSDQSDAANKKYVDDKDIGTISGAIENGKLKISLTSVDGQKVIQSEGIEIVTSEGGTVDDIVSDTSVKPVQNKVIKAYVDSFQTITILGAND